MSEILTKEQNEQMHAMIVDINIKAIRYEEIGVLNKVLDRLRRIYEYGVDDFEAIRKIQTELDNGIVLYDLQAKENNGRGVSCVRQIAKELMRGSDIGAQLTAFNNWDKIRNYETIVAWLHDNSVAQIDW